MNMMMLFNEEELCVLSAVRKKTCRETAEWLKTAETDDMELRILFDRIAGKLETVTESMFRELPIYDTETEE